MATICGKPRVSLSLTIELSEDEARALDAMAGYGDDAFIKVFYEKLGRAYMEEHEDGLRTFLKSCREQIPRVLSQADKAKKAFAE